jgi:hypothetical protein
MRSKIIQLNNAEHKGSFEYFSVQVSLVEGSFTKTGTKTIPEALIIAINEVKMYADCQKQSEYDVIAPGFKIFSYSELKMISFIVQDNHLIACFSRKCLG